MKTFNQFFIEIQYFQKIFVRIFIFHSEKKKRLIAVEKSFQLPGYQKFVLRFERQNCRPREAVFQDGFPVPLSMTFVSSRFDFFVR